MGARTTKIGDIFMLAPGGEYIPLETAASTSIIISSNDEPPKLEFNGSYTFTCDGYWESQIDDFVAEENKSEALRRIDDGAKSTITTINDYIEAFFRESKDVIGRQAIIPNIKDVRIINDKVLFVDFADGTEEKAVLCKEDTFSLEQGISICITKKILSTLTNGNGSSIYNKLIQKGLDVYKSNRQAEKDYEKYLEEEKALAKRKAEKEKRKRIKKANKEREKQIGIQKEAIIRALKELNIASADDSENVGV